MADFLPAGRSAEIAGRQISSGLIYVGAALPAADGSDPDPCLIDPNLPVARGMPDVRGQMMGYFPGYATIKPTCRLAYLQWLDGGRREAAYSVGYAFLFFYGLERALLVDRLAEHRDAIRAEIMGLIGAYGRSASMRGYARQLLDLDLLENSPAPPSPQAMHSSVGVEIAIGWRLNLGIEPTAQDLYRLAAARVRAGGRALDSCWEEFWEASRATVEETVAKATTSGQWRGAVSAIVKGASQAHQALRLQGLPAGRLPVPDAGEGPMPALQAIVRTSLKRFKPYLDAIAEDPAARGEEAALKLVSSARRGLDAALVDKRIRPWSDDDFPASLGEIRSDLPALFPDRIDARSVAEAECLLAPHGLYLFPSIVMGELKKADADTMVRVLAGSAAKEPTRPKSWPTVRLLIGLAAGIVSRSSLDSGRTSEIVRARILALFPALPTHLARAATTQLDGAPPPQPSPAAMWRAIKALPRDIRRSTALLACSIAIAAECSEDAQTHAYLAKLYKTLAQDPKQLWTDLHELAFAPSGAGQRAHGHIVDLERARLVAIETSQAHEILGDIFADDADRPQGQPQGDPQDNLQGGSPRSSAETPCMTGAVAGAGERAEKGPGERTGEGPARIRFVGLERRYQEIAAACSMREVMRREEFDSIVRDLGLLPEGVIDALNEWSFEQFDRPAIEESETNIHIDGSCFAKEAA